MRSIIQHLRFPFSFLLLPVFLFALSSIDYVSWENAIHLFVILHLLVYPSSNAFNSLQDQDEGSIGLIENPIRPHPALRWVSLLMDVVAIVWAYLAMDLQIAAMVLIYILVSRAYSYRRIRLKQYPILGFLSVVIFQGAWVFLLCFYGIRIHFCMGLGLCTNLAIASSFLIAAVYPISQIYQHEQDLKDGVKTMSYILGKKGTLIFSSAMSMIGFGIISFHYVQGSNWIPLLMLWSFPLPAFIFSIQWYLKIRLDESEANFKNCMKMNIISSICMNLLFIAIIIYQNFIVNYTI